MPSIAARVNGDLQAVGGAGFRVVLCLFVLGQHHHGSSVVPRFVGGRRGSARPVGAAVLVDATA